MSGVPWSSSDAKNATLSTCGRLWVSTNGGASFAPTTHYSYKVTVVCALDVLAWCQTAVTGQLEACTAETVQDAMLMA